MADYPAGYRQLTFNSYPELAAELDRLEQAHAEGRIETLGHWSAGQILQHVGKFMRFSFDGFPFKAPWFVAAIGRALRPFIRFMTLRPGIKFPKGAEDLAPDENVGFEEGLRELRSQIERLSRGERMDQSSPLFGHLGHERWKRMHLDHAAMHMGFITTGAETTPAQEAGAGHIASSS